MPRPAGRWRLSLPAALLILASLSHPTQYAQQVDRTGAVLLDFRTTDALTGASVPDATFAGQRVQNVAPTTLSTYGRTSGDGRLDISWAPGRYALEVTAPGYKTVRLAPDLSAGGTVTTYTIAMDPLRVPSAIEHANASVKEGFCIVYGYALDADSLRPIAGVDIRLSKSSTRAVSDSNGFFQVEIPTLAPTSDEDHPEFDTLIASKDRYKDASLHNVALWDGNTSPQQVLLMPGQGSSVSANLLPGPTAGSGPVDLDTPGGDQAGSGSTEVAPMSQSLRNWLDSIVPAQNVSP